MPKPKKIRTLRHWKQRFDKNAAFIWRRQLLFQGVLTKPGDPIPEILAENATKLRRFWESKVIELAEFDTPNVATGIVDALRKYAEGEQVEIEGLGDFRVIKGKGSWFAIHAPDGGIQKVNGQKKLDTVVEALAKEIQAAAEQAKADAAAEEKAKAEAEEKAKTEATTDSDDNPDAGKGSDGGDAPTD